VHGGQQLRLFNAHHDEYGFQMGWLPPSQMASQCAKIAVV
jgi:hypothetical protein